MMTETINITFVWNDDSQKTVHSATAAIGQWDETMNDDHVFYWFEPGEEVIGKHLDFEVLTIEEQTQ